MNSAYTGAVTRTGIALGLVVSLPAIGTATDARLLPPPGVHASTAWISDSSGPTDPSKAVPQLFVVTRAPAHPRPHLPLSLFGGLRSSLLPAR